MTSGSIKLIVMSHPEAFRQWGLALIGVVQGHIKFSM